MRADVWSRGGHINRGVVWTRKLGVGRRVGLEDLENPLATSDATRAKVEGSQPTKDQETWKGLEVAWALRYCLVVAR